MKLKYIISIIIILFLSNAVSSLEDTGNIGLGTDLSSTLINSNSIIAGDRSCIGNEGYFELKCRESGLIFANCSNTYGAQCKESICSDIDNGNNIYIKGVLNTNSYFYSSPPEDKCLVASDGGYFETNSCTGSNCYIREGLCEQSKFPNIYTYSCSYGCNDGQCTLPPCQVYSVEWFNSIIDSDQNANFNIISKNCIGQQITFNLFEEDLFNNEYIQTITVTPTEDNYIGTQSFRYFGLDFFSSPEFSLISNINSSAKTKNYLTVKNKISAQITTYKSQYYVDTIINNTYETVDYNIKISGFLGQSDEYFCVNIEGDCALSPYKIQLSSSVDWKYQDGFWIGKIPIGHKYNLPGNYIFSVQKGSVKATANFNVFEDKCNGNNCWSPYGLDFGPSVFCTEDSSKPSLSKFSENNYKKWGKTCSKSGDILCDSQGNKWFCTNYIPITKLECKGTTRKCVGDDQWIYDGCGNPKYIQFSCASSGGCKDQGCNCISQPQKHVCCWTPQEWSRYSSCANTDSVGMAGKIRDLCAPNGDNSLYLKNNPTACGQTVQVQSTETIKPIKVSICDSMPAGHLCTWSDSEWSTYSGCTGVIGSSVRAACK